MDLLQQGVEQSVIALWLGHELIETTQVYMEASRHGHTSQRKAWSVSARRRASRLPQKPVTTRTMSRAS